MRNLQSRLDEFKREFESGAPPYNATHEVIETMHRATGELEASGLANKELKIGRPRSAVQVIQSESCRSEFC